MRVDNSRHLVAAAQRRSQAAHRRAVTALRRMDNTGLPVTFDSVAHEARVSRSWLYTRPDLRAEIERLRDQRPSAPRPRIPDRQRASDASLRTRLDIALERLRQLEADNRRLRDALAEALGENRTVGARKPRRNNPSEEKVSAPPRPA